MNRRILGLALPNIITNITVPLLGMVDMAIVGHLSQMHIGAITIGTSIFNLIYWNFGFLRMGTSGFTAQAYGAADMQEALRTLVRAALIAVGIALLLLLLQWPISRLIPIIFEGSDEVMRLAISYFFVRIWAAPATLGLYAIKGWFIGMQDSKTPMWIAIALNCVNIVASLLFVLVLQWDIVGVALGTVLAQYSGLVLGLIFLRRKLRVLGLTITKQTVRQAIDAQAMRRFFAVNTDIFLRTVCLSAVFTFITAASGRISDQVLAIDALLLQFFTLFSYIMDGFAFAGESLVGRYIGAHDDGNLRSAVRKLMLWGLALTVLFSVLYALFAPWFLHIFTSDTALIDASRPYLLWVIVVPVCGFTAFLMDGIFVGATASRTMLVAMLMSTGAFFALYFGLKPIATQHGSEAWNHLLWLSFMVYLTLRGVLQAARVRKDIYSKAI